MPTGSMRSQLHRAARIDGVATHASTKPSARSASSSVVDAQSHVAFARHECGTCRRRRRGRATATARRRVLGGFEQRLPRPDGNAFCRCGAAHLVCGTRAPLTRPDVGGCRTGAADDGDRGLEHLVSDCAGGTPTRGEQRFRAVDHGRRTADERDRVRRRRAPPCESAPRRCGPDTTWRGRRRVARGGEDHARLRVTPRDARAARRGRRSPPAVRAEYSSVTGRVGSAAPRGAACSSAA